MFRFYLLLEFRDLLGIILYEIVTSIRITLGRKISFSDPTVDPAAFNPQFPCEPQYGPPSGTFFDPPQTAGGRRNAVLGANPGDALFLYPFESTGRAEAFLAQYPGYRRVSVALFDQLQGPIHHEIVVAEITLTHDPLRGGQWRDSAAYPYDLDLQGLWTRTRDDDAPDKATQQLLFVFLA